MTAGGGVSILDLDYGDRQLIVIPDLMARAAPRVIAPDASGRHIGANWISKGFGFSAEGILLNVAATVATEVVAVAVTKVRARAKERPHRILPVPKAAAKAIQFPHGHPLGDILYVGHPCVPELYYPIADFHRCTFEHKFCEVIHLLMSLGATKIRVEHVDGWSKDFSAGISVFGGQLKAGKNSNGQSNLLYAASFAGTKKPTVPDNLAWYPHEPTWQSVARGRIDFGMNKFSLNMTYQQDFGINAGLKAEVLKEGLDLGGDFQDHQSTVWRLDGTFGQHHKPSPKKVDHKTGG